MSDTPLYLKTLIAQLSAPDHPHNPYNENDAFEEQMQSALMALRLPVDAKLLEWHMAAVDTALEKAASDAERDHITQTRTITSVDGHPALLYEDAVDAFDYYERANRKPDKSPLTPSRLLDEVAASINQLQDAYWPSMTDWATLGDPASFRWKNSDVRIAEHNLIHALYQQDSILNIAPDLNSAHTIAEHISALIRQTRENVLSEAPRPGIHR